MPKLFWKFGDEEHTSCTDGMLLIQTMVIVFTAMPALIDTVYMAL